MDVNLVDRALPKLCSDEYLYQFLCAAADTLTFSGILCVRWCGSCAAIAEGVRKLRNFIWKRILQLQGRLCENIGFTTVNKLPLEFLNLKTSENKALKYFRSITLTHRTFFFDLRSALVFLCGMIVCG